MPGQNTKEGKVGGHDEFNHLASDQSIANDFCYGLLALLDHTNRTSESRFQSTCHCWVLSEAIEDTPKPRGRREGLDLIGFWLLCAPGEKILDGATTLPEDVRDTFQYASRSPHALAYAPVFHVIERQPLTGPRH